MLQTAAPIAQVSREHRSALTSAAHTAKRLVELTGRTPAWNGSWLNSGSGIFCWKSL